MDDDTHTKYTARLTVRHTCSPPHALVKETCQRIDYLFLGLGMVRFELKHLVIILSGFLKVTTLVMYLGAVQVSLRHSHPSPFTPQTLHKAVTTDALRPICTQQRPPNQCFSRSTVLSKHAYKHMRIDAVDAARGPPHGCESSYLDKGRIQGQRLV